MELQRAVVVAFAFAFAVCSPTAVAAASPISDVCNLTGVDGGPAAYVDPFWTLSGSPALPSCLSLSLEKDLKAAPLPAATMQRLVAIPYPALAALFQDSSLWPSWNILFSVVNTNVTTFQPCAALDATFHILPNIDFQGASLGLPTIVRREVNTTWMHLSWQYRFKDTSDPGAPTPGFGRHDYLLAAADCGTSTTHTWLYSWEKGGGSVIDNNAMEESHTLLKATLAAMDGVSCVESVYQATHGLDHDTVRRSCGQSPSLQWAALNAGAVFV